MGVLANQPGPGLGAALGGGGCCCCRAAQGVRWAWGWEGVVASCPWRLYCVCAQEDRTRRSCAWSKVPRQLVKGSLAWLWRWKFVCGSAACFRQFAETGPLMTIDGPTISPPHTPSAEAGAPGPDGPCSLAVLPPPGTPSHTASAPVAAAPTLAPREPSLTTSESPGSGEQGPKPPSTANIAFLPCTTSSVAHSAPAELDGHTYITAAPAPPSRRPAMP